MKLPSRPPRAVTGPGCDPVEPVLVVQKNRQETADTDESTERDGVQQTEPVHGRLCEALAKVIPPVAAWFQPSNLFVTPNHEAVNGRHQDRHQRHPKYSVPADGFAKRGARNIARTVPLFADAAMPIASP